MTMPKALGGLAEDADPMANVLIAEQLGYADAGPAKAAFDEALTYARQRIQGGVPISEHAPISDKKNWTRCWRPLPSIRMSFCRRS